MIEFTKSYKTTNGKVFSNLEDARLEEIQTLLAPEYPGTLASLSTFVIQNKDKVMDILTMTPNSKPKARMVNGGTKRRRSKSSTPSADQVSIPDSITNTTTT